MHCSKCFVIDNNKIADKECQHFINPKCLFEATEHTDIVRNIICHESRVYSAG